MFKFRIVKSDDVECWHVQRSGDGEYWVNIPDNESRDLDECAAIVDMLRAQERSYAESREALRIKELELKEARDAWEKVPYVYDY